LIRVFAPTLPHHCSPQPIGFIFFFAQRSLINRPVSSGTTQLTRFDHTIRLPTRQFSFGTF